MQKKSPSKKKTVEKESIGTSGMHPMAKAHHKMMKMAKKMKKYQGP